MVSKKALELIPELSEAKNEFDFITADDFYRLNGKTVVTLSTGINHIDKTSSIDGEIVSLPNLNAISVVEYVLYFLIKQMAKFDQRHDRSFSNYNLSELKYGIIGTGAIGGVLNNVLNLLDCEVFTANSKAEYEKLRCSNCLIISCPLTDETFGMINNNFIQYFPNLKLIVNISRPEIINESDFKNDIFLIQDFPTTIKNAETTNHIAGRTRTVYNKIVSFLKEKKYIKTTE